MTNTLQVNSFRRFSTLGMLSLREVGKERDEDKKERRETRGQERKRKEELRREIRGIV